MSFVAFLLFVFIVFLVGAPIAALVVARRARRETKEARARLLDLELELTRLRETVGALGGAPAAPTAEETAPEPALVPPEPAAEPVAPEATKPEVPPTGPQAEAPAPFERPPTAAAPADQELPTPPPAAEPPPPSRPTVQIDWEQWLGVRGAAVLGGAVLALAALLFLKFSIERGLIPPPVRVALGVLAGIGALIASDRLRTRGYRPASNALAGAGIVALYASIWAAESLYSLIPTAVAFAFMILVTAVCGLLAWRRASRVVALLGLAGGFATPLLLATGFDRPIGLFGYILLLDVGLVLLARQRGWPLLAALGVAATALYQARWILGQLRPEQSWLAFAVVAAFAGLSAASARLAPTGREDRTWRQTAIAGVLLPFAFALYFAARADFGTHFWPVALLLAFLAATALWLARTLATPALAVAAAAAVAGVFLVWAGGTDFTDALAWEAAGVGFALALIFHLVGRRTAAREGRSVVDWGQELADPALVAVGGVLLTLLVSHLDETNVVLWPWLGGWIAAAALLVLQGADGRRAYRRGIAAIALGLGFLGFLADHGHEARFPAPALFFGLAVAVAVVLQIVALRSRASAARHSEVAAAAMPIVLLLGMIGGAARPPVPSSVYLATTLALALLIVLAATRSRIAALHAAAVALLVLAQSIGFGDYLAGTDRAPSALLWLGVLAGSLLFVTFWPFLASKAFAADRWVLYTSALAAPAWFFVLRRLFVLRFGDGAIGILPVALGLVSLGAARLARRAWPAESLERKRSLVWFLAVALGFLTLAIPLQLDREWVTIGWALQGAAMLALWKRLDHSGLKYFGLALLAVVALRLIANPAILGYHEKSAWPVFNWLMYTYLVPGAALLASGRLLAAAEVERLRPWESSLYPTRKALGALGCGVGAILVIFAWINLTILDAFSPGGALGFGWERQPARDLTLSLAWTVYAVVLLAIGMARKSVGLRWISLAFLILTIGKVFLYDLGELRDLYRVGSLVGLALSLLAVSLAYQRFVFPAKPRGEEP